MRRQPPRGSPGPCHTGSCLVQFGTAVKPKLAASRAALRGWSARNFEPARRWRSPQRQRRGIILHRDPSVPYGLVEFSSLGMGPSISRVAW